MIYVFKNASFQSHVSLSPADYESWRTARINSWRMTSDEIDNLLCNMKGHFSGPLSEIYQAAWINRRWTQSQHRDWQKICAFTSFLVLLRPLFLCWIQLNSSWAHRWTENMDGQVGGLRGRWLACIVEIPANVRETFNGFWFGPQRHTHKLVCAYCN